MVFYFIFLAIAVFCLAISLSDFTKQVVKIQDFPFLLQTLLFRAADSENYLIITLDATP